MLLRQSPPGAVGAVLSIHGRHEFPVEAPAGVRRLVLQFDDADAIDWADPDAAWQAWARQKWAADVGRPLTPPTVGDAGAIIEFAVAVRDVGGAVLFQCQGGISRSPAAALLCLAAWAGEGRERNCAEQVRHLRPAAFPLMTLVKLGDGLLGRQGRLVGTVQEVWRQGA